MYKVSGKRIEILGVKIDNITFNGALVRIKALVEEGRRGKPKYIVKPNTEIITYAQEDGQFKNILNSADLAPPDGVGLMIASRKYGRPLKERVGGPDLTEGILKLAEDNGHSVLFLGAKPHVVKKLTEVVRRKYPKIILNGFADGYFETETESESEIIEGIKRASPDILFVALGFPKQEKWIRKHLSQLKVPLSIAEGGSFDFISGEIASAPVWIRKVGLELFYRLIRQPARIRRQAALPKFLWLVLTKA